MASGARSAELKGFTLGLLKRGVGMLDAEGIIMNSKRNEMDTLTDQLIDLANHKHDDHSIAEEAAFYIRNLLRECAYYRKRVLELEKRKHEFPKPYYTKICNILANGRAEP